MARIMITLQTDERAALFDLAERERRDPRDQAALFVRDGLRREGLLLTDTSTSFDVRLGHEAVTHANQ
jgi:hypothetical protein